MKPMVFIRYGYAECRIESGTLSTDVVNALSEACSYEIEGAEHMKRSGKFGANWDGKKRLYHKGHRKFPTGLYDRVVSILENHGYEIQSDVPDEQDVLVGHYNPPGAEWCPRDYQNQAVLTATGAGRGMIKVATGGGKTIIAGHIIHVIGRDTVFLVHTKDLLYQAKDVFSKMFGSWHVGQIGDGVVEPADITITTIQTAARALNIKYEKDSYAEGEDDWTDGNTDHQNTAIRRTLDEARVVFMDECHRVAAPTATAVVSSIRNAPYRYGLSASPWRDDGADLALEAVFGPVIVDIPATDLIERGHLVAPIIRFRQVPAMKFPKGTKYQTIYDQYIVDNQARNELVIADTVSKVRRGLPTLVLVRRIDHGRFLQSHIGSALGRPVSFLSGKDDSSLRREVIEDLRSGRSDCLVASTVADEGLDIKPLAGLVLAGGGKSSTRALQRVGRILRPFDGKKHCEVTDFWDNAKFLYDHSRARERIYASEPSFSILDF